MKAKLAYLTTPQVGRYVLHFQPEDEPHVYEFEISKAHLANIIIDGTTLALRDIDNRSVNHRVPAASPTENANERAEHRT